MRRREMLGAAVAAALVAGLGSGCADPAPPSTPEVVDPGTPASKPSPTPDLPLAPLSGLPVTSAAVAARQAVAVPIRVAATSTPAGLTAADLVYQEFAESGSLHLTAVFQSRDATRIGPVTEIRPVDIRSVGVLHPVVGYAGGPTGFLSQFKESGLAGVTPEQRRAAFPSGYTSTAALLAAAPKGGAAPTAVFDHADSGTPLATQDVVPAGELTIAVSGHPTQTWRYDAANATWLGQVGKVQVSAGAVVVLTMPYRTLSVRKPSPRSLPGAFVYGEGAALVVSGPASAKAKWRKPGQQAVCHVTDLAGYQVRPRAGAVWVVYAPTTAKVAVK